MYVCIQSSVHRFELVKDHALTYVRVYMVEWTFLTLTKIIEKYINIYDPISFIKISTEHIFGSVFIWTYTCQYIFLKK